MLLSSKRTGSGQLATPYRLRQLTLTGTYVAVVTVNNSVNALTTTTAIVTTSVVYEPRIYRPIVKRQDQSARSRREVNDARDFDRSYQGRAVDAFHILPADELVHREEAHSMLRHRRR